MLVLCAGALSACSTWLAAPETTVRPAEIEPATHFSADLAQLPPPNAKITVAVYGF